MLLAEDLKDKKSGVRAGEIYGRARERRGASSSSRVARANACRSNAPNLSVKTAVFQQPQRRTIWWLIIDKLSLCCFLTPSLSLSVSVSLPSLTPFLSQKLDTGSNMKAADLCLGLSQVISHPPPPLPPDPPSTPWTGYPLSFTLSSCLSSLSPHPLLLWHLLGRHRDPHISTHPTAQPQCRFYPTRLHVGEKQE